MRSKLLSQGGLAAVATVVLVLAVPLSASAHVRLYPKQAVAGADDTLLTFSVPTESGTATTRRVQIDLPTATPFGDVSYQPVAGWSAQVVTEKLPKPAKVAGTTVTEAPTRVVFTADPGTNLTGGQFQDFTLTVSPVPDTGQVAFPTTQTYSDGKIVRWSQTTPASGEAPANPAPVLYINDAPPVADRLTSGTVGLSAQPPASSTDVTVVLTVAVAALVVAAIAAVLALLAILSARRTRKP